MMTKSPGLPFIPIFQEQQNSVVVAIYNFYL